LIRFTTACKQRGLITEEDFLRLQAAADAEVDAAVAYAEAGEWEPVGELERHVYAEARA
jgi:TPP-dependent pyruvate/acetoin dehydrogenase alpha subunit